MSIVLNGTTGITTPDVTSDGLTVDSTTLVVDETNNRVGIGTSSPSSRLHLSGAATADARLTFTQTTAGLSGQIQQGSTGFAISALGSQALIMDTNGAERARIDSSGNLLVGKTSGSERLSVAATQEVAAFQNTGGTGNFRFLNSGASTIGYIQWSGSTTSYVTSSDYRLKEDWEAVADASTRVNALKPINFAWKADGSRVDGFLAHEVAEVVPEAVTGEKDAIEMVDVYDEDGNVTGQEERPVYQGIDQAKLVPLLTAALQEALAKIDDLTARVSALEAV